MDRQFAYDQRQERIAEQQRHDDAMWRHLPAPEPRTIHPYEVRFKGLPPVTVEHGGEPEEAMERAWDLYFDEQYRLGVWAPTPEWCSVWLHGVEVMVAHRLVVVAKQGGKQWGQRINTQEAA